MPRPHDRRCPHLGAPPLKRKPVLSSSYRNRILRTAVDGAPPPPEPDLEVKGTLTPDATGDYYETGTHNGKPYYVREDDAWFLWWEHVPFIEIDVWNLTEALDEHPAENWQKQDFGYQPPPGDYDPFAGAIGTATVQLP